MTKKDYIIIAKVLRNYKAYDKESGVTNPLEYFITELSYQMALDNPRFDEGRFRQFINN